MKNYIALLVCLITFSAQAQRKLTWNKDYILTFSDFKSPSNQIGNGNIYSIQSGINFSFEFSMTNYEFMFTKNFNSKVSNDFNQDLASIVAPDSTIALGLLHWSNYEFDLSELYARKVRKKLFESKGTFSNTNFFMPIFNEFQNEFSIKRTEAMNLTDIGQKREELIKLHEAVNEEIEQLNDYCKTCKPAKKKK